MGTPAKRSYLAQHVNNYYTALVAMLQRLLLCLATALVAVSGKPDGNWKNAAQRHPHRGFSLTYRKWLNVNSKVKWYNIRTFQIYSTKTAKASHWTDYRMMLTHTDFRARTFWFFLPFWEVKIKSLPESTSCSLRSPWQCRFQQFANFVVVVV